MNIGVDIRCLMNSNRTGVGEYTFGLLNSLFQIDKQNQYFLFYNSSKNVSRYIPKWDQENVRYVYTHWPNKLLNLLLFLKFVKLDNICHCEEAISRRSNLNRQTMRLPRRSFLAPRNDGEIDIWFSPNLNFTSLSKKTKLILTVHDLSFEFLPECFTLKQRLWHWFLRPRKQCQRADLILTPSENTAKDVIESYLPAVQAQALQAGKVRKVYKVIKLCPGVSCKPEAVSQKDEKYILYLGTLEPRKNVETLILAYKKAYSLGLMAYSLVIAGDKGWKSKPTMELIKNTPNVKYIGYASEAEKQALYKNASLFVFPSLYEGFGLPVLEAMSAGVPVITSNRSSLPEVGGDAVFYVNPNNVSELAEAMKAVLIDEKLRQTMIQKGLEQAKKFSWEQTAVALKNCFMV